MLFNSMLDPYAETNVVLALARLKNVFDESFLFNEYKKTFGMKQINYCLYLYMILTTITLFLLFKYHLKMQMSVSLLLVTSSVHTVAFVKFPVANRAVNVCLTLKTSIKAHFVRFHKK